MTAIETLKQWFSNLKKPTQEQFWAWLDSFWHKSEKIPMASVEGLDKLVEGTASAEQLSNHLNDTQAHKVLFDKKVDKVEGKELSSNDFTNEYKEKLEGLHQVDISGLLPKGDYTGTAQDLKKQIDDKADKNHKHSWEDIEGKPNFSESITSKKFIKEGSSDEYLLTGGGGQVSKADLVSSGFKGNLSPEELNTFKYRDTGCWNVTYPGGWGLYVNFKGAGSTSSLEFLKSNWYSWTRIGVRNSVDGARFNDDKGAFRDLAWFSDVYREGAKCEGNTTLRVDHQNQVIFVTVACSIDLSTIQNMGSVSFRKVFDGGNIIFTCEGKNITYTSDIDFDGKKGSTAVISIFENDCYIDIRNV